MTKQTQAARSEFEAHISLYETALQRAERLKRYHGVRHKRPHKCGVLSRLFSFFQK